MNQYHYYRRMPHFQGRGGPIFITFSTIGRRELEDFSRDIVLRCCMRGDPSHFCLLSVVVMPDHVHMILSPAIRHDESIPLQEILKSIKGASARLINKARHEAGPVWQEESFDRVIRNVSQLSSAVEYIAENPVVAKLVKVPGDYPWFWIATECRGQECPRSTKS